ncbi:salivary endonuclease-like [Haematobia irritans]|uniref:salivary endonuclease-like n=1 Tax=Haematobia irritans TaxID=7368 RepID=UPI003F4F74CF
MKIGASLLLLIAGVCCLSQVSLAGVVGVPSELLENLKISDDLPEVPPMVEDEIFERNVYVDVLPEGRANECSITIRGGLSEPQPVFLKTDAAEFYPYSNTGVMQVDAGKTMQMFCPGEFKVKATKLITATCVSGTTFKIDGTNYAFSELVCKSWPSFVAKKKGTTCNGGILIGVGFEVSSSRFVEQMEICFNEQEEVTRYVRHTMGPANNYYQTGVDRITFQTGGFFNGKNVDKLYTQVTQLETINSELGGDADKYFDTNKNIYLARGHMGAKADFVYGTQQRATFLFINAAPQWQVFNAGNWARVEDGVRDWVSKNSKNVNCYTGVWGVTTLPNKSGVQTPLYLAHDSNNNGLIPVPKIYFRVVIEPSTHKGIVFIGVNNPHLTLDQIKKDYIICTDVSDKVTYINWKKTDITAGYSYACEVADFLKTVKHLPALTASGGLLI